MSKFIAAAIAIIGLVVAVLTWLIPFGDVGPSPFSSSPDSIASTSYSSLPDNMQQAVDAKVEQWSKVVANIPVQNVRYELVSNSNGFATVHVLMDALPRRDDGWIEYEGLTDCTLISSSWTCDYTGFDVSQAVIAHSNQARAEATQQQVGQDKNLVEGLNIRFLDTSAVRDTPNLRLEVSNNTDQSKTICLEGWISWLREDEENFYGPRQENGAYPNYDNCSWTIAPHANEVITIEINGNFGKDKIRVFEQWVELHQPDIGDGIGNELTGWSGSNVIEQ